MQVKKEEPKLTQQQQEALRDEQTVWGLAVLMMDIHTYTMLKNKQQVANAFLKAGVVLQNNPGFPKRFRDAQQALVKRGSAEMPTKDVLSAHPKPPEDLL